MCVCVDDDDIDDSSDGDNIGEQLSRGNRAQTKSTDLTWLKRKTPGLPEE